MNLQLSNALGDLNKAGAVGLPSSSTIESAPDGTEWKGVQKDGGPWSLKKNAINSYNCMFGKA